MSEKAKPKAHAEEEKAVTEEVKKCGIVMPISPIDNCSAGHWQDVLHILKDAITQAGFEPNLVSDSDEIGIIQKRIVQNIYTNEVIVADVSGKNPNVMFELGMRLAFDKPTIVIKDDKTDYSFDTSPLEHLAYPRDLRYADIVAFKAALVKKIAGTVTASGSNSFLKSFGDFHVAKLHTKEVSQEQYVIESLAEIKRMLTSRAGVAVTERYERPRPRSAGPNQPSRDHLIRVSALMSYHEYKEKRGITGSLSFQEVEEILNEWLQDPEVKAMALAPSEIEDALDFLRNFSGPRLN